MKGDFTRSTFKKKNHFNRVMMQQGRVQLDADWNEQLDITAHRTDTGTLDTLGHCAAPLHNSGFHLVENQAGLTPEEQALDGNQNPDPLQGAGDFYISAGRFYVNGILCQNEKMIPYSGQADNPGTTPVAAAGTYLGYLEVWNRHLTALEDPSIREKALGGPDTATRSKTIQQVKVVRVGDENADVNCLTTLAAWNAITLPMTGKLAAQAEQSAVADKPCILSPGAGYRRLENQFYRVEVHKSGTLGTATFKWSRDNGSIVTKWEKQDTDKLTVSSSGKDDVLNFASGDWIELTDDERDLQGKRGILVQLKKVEGLVLIIEPATINDPDNPGINTVDINDFEGTPKVRRWDSDGEVDIANANWLDLEDGVQVQFSAGTYRTGDYWWVPARTVTADVEWPIDPATDLPELQSPHGITRHFCRLGLLRFDGAAWTGISDCRPKFPPITELTSLFYVSGDGQEAMPGDRLPKPLQVGVSNGQWPVEGAIVSFTRVEPAGALQVSAGTPAANIVSAAADQIVLLTGSDGLAQCDWALDGNASNTSQQVEAVLLDPEGGTKHLPVRFNANLSVAAQVYYDPGACTYLSDPAKNIDTVQEAIHELCERTATDIPYTPGNCDYLSDPAKDIDTVKEALDELCERTAADILYNPNCSFLSDQGVDNVQDALNELCARESQGGGCSVTVGANGQFEKLEDAVLQLLGEERSEICICLLAGDHDLSNGLQMAPTNAGNTITNITISGCGFKSRILLDDAQWTADGLQTLTLRNLSVFAASGTAEVMKFDNCQHITIDSCYLQCHMDQPQLLQISNSSRIHLENNFMFAGPTSGIGPLTLPPRFNTQGIALAIMDGHADTILEGNTIMGVVSLYGSNSSDILSQSEINAVASLMKAGGINFRTSNGNFHICHNRIGRITVGSEVINALKIMVGNGDADLPDLGRVGIFSDNIIEDRFNYWVAARINFTSNYFASPADNDLGTSITQGATFTGNQSAGNGTILNAANSQQSPGYLQDANLLINIVNI